MILLAVVEAIGFSMLRAREARRIRRARPRAAQGYAREYRRGREYGSDRDYEEVEVKRTVKRKKK